MFNIELNSSQTVLWMKPGVVGFYSTILKRSKNHLPPASRSTPRGFGTGSPIGEEKFVLMATLAAAHTINSYLPRLAGIFHSGIAALSRLLPTGSLVAEAIIPSGGSDSP